MNKQSASNRFHYDFLSVQSVPCSTLSTDADRIILLRIIRPPLSSLLNEKTKREFAQLNRIGQSSVPTNNRNLFYSDTVSCDMFSLVRNLKYKYLPSDSES